MSKAIAELIGTFVFVLFAVSAIAFGGASGLELALTVAFVLVAATVLVAGLSGAHLNPAVTLGSVVSGRTALPDAVQYWIGQFIGAIAAVFVVWLVAQVADVEPASYGGNVVGGLDVAGTFIVEALIVAFFVLVYLKVAESESSLVGRAVTIGITFGAVYLVAGAATGGSANMAKSVGAAIFEAGDTDALADLWLFVVAGAVGAVLGALAHLTLRGQAADRETVSS